MNERLSRRNFLRAAAISTVGAALVACATPAPEKVVVTVEVEKPVEKVVEKTVERVITPTPRPTPAKVAFLNFLSQETDPKEVEVYRKMILDFEAQNPDIRIQMQFTQAEQIVEKMVAILVSGVSAMDVLQPNPPMAFLLATKGYLLSVDDVIQDLGGEDQFYRLIKWEGKNYAVPFGGGATTIWYRKDLFDAEGLKAPTTFEELETAAKHFTRKFNPNSPTEYGISLPLSKTSPCEFFAMPFFWANGAEICDKDLNVVFDSPEAEETLDFYARMAQYTPEAAINYSWADMINTLLSGQTAMTFYLGRVLGRTYQNAPHLVGKVQAALYPRRKLQTCHDDPNIYVINAKTPNPDACKRWIKYALTTDLQFDFLCSIPSHLPPATVKQQKWWDQAKTGCKALDENPDVKAVTGMAQKIAYYPFLDSGGILEAVKQGKPNPVKTGVANPFLTAIGGNNPLVPEAIQNVVINKMTPKDALKEVVPKMVQAIETSMKDVGWKK